MSENEVQETEIAGENTETVLEVNTDTSINASLDEIDDAETLKKMVAKLRKENAKSRTEKNELKTKAEKWAEYEESQKTELEKLQSRVQAAEERAAAKAREAILAKYKLDEDDELAEFITGTEEEMELKAQRLAERLGKSSEGGLVPDLFKQSGEPVKVKKDDGGDFLTFLAQRDLGA